MEPYTLVALVAVFLGIIGIVAMLEWGRRNEQEHFDHVHQTLAGCLDTLRPVHAGNAAQSAQLVEALNQLRAAVETGANNATASSRALSEGSVRAIEQAATNLGAAVLQHQKSVDVTLVTAAEKLSESSLLRSKELLAEAQRTTKAVEALKTSLEESVTTC